MPGTEISTPGTPGLYGKLPARGDFLSRRLDADFIAAWDEWLQRVMRESREVLGARWLECFLSAPVWRFVAPAGMYSSAGRVGLVVPSVDRVGRYFPLTIAAAIHADGIDAPSTLAKAQPWLDSIEALALDALSPGLDFEAFDQRLAGLRLAADATALSPSNDDTVPLGVSQASFRVSPLPREGTDAALAQLLGTGFHGRRTSCAVWLTRGGETHGPCVAICGAPIPGDRFCALLDGCWQDHSWTLSADPGGAGVMYCTAQNPGSRLDSRSGHGAGDAEARPLIAPPGSQGGADMNTGLEK